jgi:diguanylate cyclase (GGDEF)-like protein/PAS domain S-box-containing protein
MEKPSAPVSLSDGEVMPCSNDLFNIFPDPLFIIDAEKAKDYLLSLIESGVTDIESYLREHPLAILKLAKKTKFLSTNQAAVNFYQAQNKRHLLKEFRDRKPDRFQFSFSTDLQTFFEKKKNLEIRLNYVTILGKPINLKLKLLFIDQDAPSFQRLFLIINDITEQVQIEKVRDAIYKISEYTHEVHDLQELFAFIHTTVNKLVPAKNFFIALANYEKGLIDFPYLVDEYDDRPDPIPLGQGFTSYVLKTGKPLLATPEVANALIESEEVISHGSDSVDWLGIPLVINQNIIGVLTVQTYHENERLSQKDMDILQFVSTQIAMAIARKIAEEEVSKFKALSDSANYGISILNEEGNYIYCNTHYAHMHGVEPKDILGHRFPLFQKVSGLEELDAWIKTLLNNEKSNVREMLHIHKDGHQFPVLMHIAPIRDNNEVPIFTTLTAVDITDQKQQNEVLRRYANRLKALHQIDQAILESRSPEQIASAALENLQKLIRLDHACVTWIYDDDRYSELLAVYHHPSIKDLKLRSEIESICSQLPIPSKEIDVQIRNLAETPKLSPLEKLLYQAGIKYYLSIPLKVNNELVGLLNLGTRHKHQSVKENLEIVQEVGQMLAIALQQSKLNRRIQQLAITDDLTGICNRRQLLKLGQQEFKRAKRYKKPLSLIMFDPDSFKTINDSYGHLVGDEVLIEITRRCAAQIRETDIIGRYGGDEFIVILPETSIEDAQLAARRLLSAVHDELFQTEKGSITLSISLGVTELSDDENDQELKDVVNRADVALYAAKRGGRNRITVL